MPYPYKYDRQKEPAQPIITKIMQATAEGTLPVTIRFESSAKAEYIKCRIYAVWRALNREAKEANMEPLDFPVIVHEGNTITFKKREPLEYTIVTEHPADAAE